MTFGISRQVKTWLVLTCLGFTTAYFIGLAAIVFFSRRAEITLDRIGHGPVVAVVFYDDDSTWRRARVAHAVNRLLQGTVQHIVMTGGSRPGRSGYQGSKTMVEDAIAFGAPAQSLHYDAGSNDTISNLGEGFRMAEEFKASGVELISDKMHLGRIMLLSTTHCREIACRFVVAPVPLSFSEWFRRAHHEMAAYLSLTLPRKWVEAWLARQRHATSAHHLARSPA